VTNPISLGVSNITIIGSGFIAGSQATLGGTNLVTSYVSPNQLSATVLVNG